MIRRPPRSTRTDTLFPNTTLFRSRRRPVPYDPGEAVLCIAGGEIAVNLADRERQFFGCRNIGGHADEGGARAVHPEAFAIGGRRPEHRRDFLKFVDDFDGITAIDVRKGIEARERKSTRLHSSHECASRMPSSG